MEAATSAGEIEIEQGGLSRPKGLKLNDERKSSNSPSTPQGISRMPAVLKELLTSRRPITTAKSQGTPTYSPDYIPYDEDYNEDNDKGVDVKVLRFGNLHKTSQSRRPDAVVGPTRQRRFRLTRESLEYFQHFSHVKIRRSYPLTSIEDIVYPLEEDKQSFQLVFATYLMTLRSDSESDAVEWVEHIRKAWMEWQLPTPVDSERGVALPTPSSLHPIAEEEESTAVPSQVTRPPVHTNPQPRRLSEAIPGPTTPSAPPAIDRPRSNTHSGFLRRESSDVEFPTYDKRKHNKIRGLRIRKVHKQAPQLEKQHHHNETTLSSKLHEDHAMIKYPRSRWSIPSEKVVKIDKDNLVVIWRHNHRAIWKKRENSRQKLRSSLCLNKVLEVRKGQLTEKFDQFPYEEVEDQSFSLIFEQVTKRYVRLTSLDLICDSPEKCEDWIHGLRETTNHLSCSIFPSELYDNTDPTVLWLKQLWAVSQDNHEISQRDALDMLTMFRPDTMKAKCRQILSESHHYQFRHTYLRGNALRWDGFVLMFNLLCSNGGRLGALFRKYAVRYPKLGLTEEEFKAFLMEECQWPEYSCSSFDLQTLMSHHDYHHRAYKKYVAKGIPLEYQIGSTLLSYAGFLSFLRSKDNTPINLEHTNIYQDMTQPLSHYFINSSHNTYLEADQLYGKSSTDAYIRTLLQGCRCIEIDCWDDRLNVTGVGSGEPVIYHGYTFTTKLPFREVIQTIKEYAFTASFFPLIISIENHCSSAQQTKMAKIFQAVMGDLLPKENLCEKQCRTRLPSPQELQGKIILKGSFKHSKQAAGGKKTPRQETSLAPEEYSITSSMQQSPAHQTAAKEPLEETAVNLLRSREPHKSLRRRKSSRSSRVRHLKESVNELQESGKLDNTIYQDDDQELIFSETVGDMKSLIIYCRAISIKPWSFDKQEQTPVSNMFSFGEPSALRRCDKYPMRMLKCTERQLVRTYPRGTRFDSANYPAMTMWQCGVQMVALNFQYPDVQMHLNQGLFRLNGGCGYVLKPDVMRRTEITFNPTMKEPHPEVPPINLEIELLSGQQLCYWGKKCISCTVDVHTYGIANDTGEMSPAYSTDLFWPQWGEGLHIYKKRVLMPELCMVYFRVNVTRGRQAGRKTTLYGQNCIPLNSLLPGIKYIPLRTPGGELIPESGLFVRIKKEENGDPQGGAHQRRKKFSQQKEIDMDIAEEDMEGTLPKQRSFTSPPLLGSVDRSCLDDGYPLKEMERGRQHEIQVTAEVHDTAEGPPEATLGYGKSFKLKYDEEFEQEESQ